MCCEGVLVSVLSISYLMSPLSVYFSLCKSVRLISLLGSLVLCLGEPERQISWCWLYV
jgi:hypothetical protein